MADSNVNWFDPSTYTGIPHTEVNWAHLAQRWIAMRDAGEIPTPSNNSPQPPPPPPLQQLCDAGGPRSGLNRPNESNDLTLNSSFIPPGGAYMPHMPVGAPPAAAWLPPMPNNFGPAPGGSFPPFMPPPPPWIAPPIGVQQRSMNIGAADKDVVASKKIIGKTQENNEYAHYYKEWEEKPRSEDSEEAEGVPQGAMAHWLAPGPDWAPSPNWYGPTHRNTVPGNVPFIDHQMRKALPAWLRDGLEKAELERKKKAEKELKLQKAEEFAKKRKAEKGLGKFDSDSSDDESKSEGSSINGTGYDGDPIFLKKKNQQSEVTKLEDEDAIDYRTDQEKRDDTLLLLRDLMTGVLMEATDIEFNRIYKEQIELAKRSAQPKVLVQSSALAALSSLGNGSDDDDFEDEITMRSQQSSSIGNVSVPASDESIFKKPLLLQEGMNAKSKAKLSSNGGFSSTESSPKGAIDEKTVENDGRKLQTREAHVSENDLSGCERKNLDQNQDKDDFARSGNDEVKTHSSKLSKKDNSKGSRNHSLRDDGKRSGNSKKRSRTSKHRSRSHDRSPKKRKRSSSSRTESKSSSSEERESRTPERYRRRSRSAEKVSKWKRSDYRRYSRSRSRERDSRRSNNRSSNRRSSRERTDHRKRSRRSSS